VAISAEGKFAYPTGMVAAEALGYDPVFIHSAPSSLLKSFCGVGNPFSLGEILPGNSALDIGCGAGFDLYVAQRLVGESGKVCGLDLTREMVNLARRNLAESGMDDIEVVHVSSEEIPYKENTFDVVISNGVINLTPSKEDLFREIFRVLRNGGRLLLADVVLERELPHTFVGSLEAWSQ
jgi:arsenite methyltransferase